MNFVPRNWHGEFRLVCPLGMLLALLVFASGTGVARASQTRLGNQDFLIQNWLEDDGLPESSAYSLTQTPDGYLWVGTAYGVLRFNGYEFSASGRGSSSPILTEAIQYLYADHAGNLWASGDLGLAVREDGIWHDIRTTNLVARSMASDATGHLWLGSYDGRLFTIQSRKLYPAQTPAGFTQSGVFCLEDAQDHGLWLANRGFIGRPTDSGWTQFGPAKVSRNSLLAAPAQNGGIWTYTPGTLIKYETNGTTREFPAPNVDQPRVLMEDNEGYIWLASTLKGYLRLKPGGPIVATATATNGLVHNSAWCLLQGREGNFWVGSSCGGLSRLEPKVFHVIGVPEGLPNQIVRTVTEESPGRIIVGTHGGGKVEIKNYRASSPGTNRTEDYAWCVLHDHSGRNWSGTYGGGLWVEENGVDHRFPLPATLGTTVACLMEDSRQRIWVGTSIGLGMIDHGVVADVSSNSVLAGKSLWCLAKDPHSDTLWIGTYGSGLFRLKDHQFTHYGKEQGVPSDRISCLMFDQTGDLWIGLYDKGLDCMHGDHISMVGQAQGLLGGTVGYMVDDGLGWIWFGTDHGIMRVSATELTQLAHGQLDRGHFELFDSSDGLYSADCSAGYQPAAIRDHAGHLWFATMNGVVTVDPARIHLNTNPPPVMLESANYVDADGRMHNLSVSSSHPVDLPPGSQDLNFNFAALSYTAPEKNRYAYRLEGFNNEWLSIQSRHTLYLHVLAHGTYRLQIKASNNDGVWNQRPDDYVFIIRPYFWETTWFRLLMLVAVAGVGGLAAWQLTLARVRQRITRLEQQRALEQERARLAIVMEATSDLVAFADNEGRLLHMNPAGRRLLGLDANQDLTGMTLDQMHPPESAARVATVGIPTARQAGVWEGETLLKHRDGHEIPANQSIMAHRGQNDSASFLSTIARDITAQKLAEQSSERLQAQLLQAQKMESVGRLAGGIAHDFNNMLQVIIGNTDLALVDAPPSSELRDELLEIQKSACRSAELTSQLLTFARKQVFHAQELNLATTVAGTSKMLQRLIGENIKLVMRADEGLWSVRMDPSQVTQILTNLAINARDAIGNQGQLVIQLSNVVLPRKDMPMDEQVIPGEYIMLSVQDDGEGMSPQVMEHLFEPFFTTKDVGRGTGLGLATIFGIVKQNHGFIQVESAPGQGATFRIFFPRNVTTPMTTSTPPAGRQPVRGTETILIVEDEENILQLIVITLRRHGYQVIAAPVPEMALIMASSHPGKIDLLVTDVVMPGMNGKQLQEKLAVIQPAMKSLFMSGYTSEVIAQHGDLEPGLNFLQKPFTIQGFLEKVRKILENR